MLKIQPRDTSIHISDDIKKRVESKIPIGLQEYRHMKGNSYEQEAMLPLLTDEALFWLVEHSMGNCSRKSGLVASTYDEAIIHNHAPLLMKRLHERNCAVFELRKSLKLLLGLVRNTTDLPDGAANEVTDSSGNDEGVCMAMNIIRCAEVALEKYEEPALEV